MVVTSRDRFEIDISEEFFGDLVHLESIIMGLNILIVEYPQIECLCKPVICLFQFCVLSGSFPDLELLKLLFIVIKRYELGYCLIFSVREPTSNSL